MQFQLTLILDLLWQSSDIIFFLVFFIVDKINFLVVDHFTVVCLVVKPLIWSGAECDLVVIETSI